MIEATTTLLHDVTREVLEDAAFLMTEPASDEVTWSDRLTRASVAFRGPMSGKLSLVAGEELLVAVAADMLGVTPDDADAHSHAEAALAELANIVAGSLMAKLFGTTMIVQLGVPELSRETAELAAAAAREGAVRIDMEQRPLLVALEVEREVFS